jgi:hypothetical protein
MTFRVASQLAWVNQMPMTAGDGAEPPRTSMGAAGGSSGNHTPQGPGGVPGGWAELRTGPG